MVAHKVSYFRHTFVFLMSKELRPVLFCIGSHASELVDSERSPEPSYTFLPKNGRPSIFTSDEEVADTQYWGE